MSYSLDRLIDLAKKTGDRLIVHDPMFGQDVVIMDVDVYEKMALGNKSDKKDNNDWMGHMDWDGDETIGPSFGSDNDMCEDDCEDDPWHSAGSILQERQKEMGIDESMPWEPEIEGMKVENPGSSVEEPQPVELKKEAEPNEWKEEALGGDEPVFYEEPV